ncbi:carbohydrate-binding protein [Yeosuana marina]|uniref:carbohydrate-binding protein n=1 Tax=Yeosuana marina TaxID=1565536 RepID=UPI0030C8703B
MILKNMRILKLKYLILFLVASIFSCSNDDVREVTLFEKGTAEATVSSTSIDFGETVNFSSTSTKVQSLEWTFTGGSPSSSLDPDVTVTYAYPGTFEAKLVVKYIDNTYDTKTFTIVVVGPDAPLPYSGTPLALPGTIEAENYDLGGEGVAYHDAEAENKAETAGSPTYRDDDGIDIEVGATQTNIGYSNADEWANYTVEIAEAGSFDFDFQVASGSTDGGKSLKLQLVNPDTGEVSDLGETGDFANTGGWGVYTSAMISGVNLAAGTNTLRVYFTGGGTNLDKINVTTASTGGGGIPLGPLNIAFVTDDVSGDQGYIDLLEGAGHTVEAEAGKYNNLDAAGAATLNGFDLVIISRNTNSVNFDAPIVDIWASVTTPVLNMSSFIARSSRLQYFNSASQLEGVGTSITATVATHPVFTNITLPTDNTFEIATAGLHVVVDSSNPGNGTLIATDATGAYATVAEWDANTAAYPGATVFAGKRMFLAGTGGGFTYNDAGSQLFLNCVEYIVSGTVYDGGGSTGPIDALGFYTERETTESNPAEVRTPSTVPASNSGNFNLSEVSDAAEGNVALYANYATTGTGNDVTWGALVSMYPVTLPLDLSAYNYYHISLKAPAENVDPIRLRFRTDGGNYWVTLNTEYGFTRDGQWHDLKIPFADMKLDGGGAALDADKSAVTEVMFRSDTDVAGLGTNFDWYIDDIYFTVD